MPSNSSLHVRTLFLRDLTLRKSIPFLFLPAGIGLLFQAALAPSLAHRILAIALMMFCPELARMAWIDLKNIEYITKPKALDIATDAPQESDDRETGLPIDDALRVQQIDRFYRVVVSTIVLETTGFYLSLLSLPFGSLVIVASQLWFNLLANVQIYPAQTPSVISSTIQDRKVILVINILTTGLLCFWPIASVRLWLALTLLTLVGLYLTVKYLFLSPKLD